MSCSDTVADYLTHIRNANAAKHEKVDIPASKMKEELSKVLKEEGYIRNYKKIDNHKQGIIRIYLKYDENGGYVISGIRRVSKPGRRVYYKAEDLPKIQGGLGILMVSTSRGIMTGQQAKSQNVGGEAVCAVW